MNKKIISLVFFIMLIPSVCFGAQTIYKTFANEDILTHTDMNGIQTNILENALAVISPLTGDLAAGGNNISGIGTATATTFVGDLTGDVTGDVTGDLTGDVTGNVIGTNITSTLFTTYGYTAKPAGCVSWKDADEIYIEANMMDCKGKLCYWDSQLTKDVGSPDATDWYYVYLDYSEITSKTAITATEIITSNTEPTYNGTYKEWLNGDDRCIGCFLTDGASNVLEFAWCKHTGYYEHIAEKIEEYSGDPGAGYIDLDISSSVPDFGEVMARTMVIVDGGGSTTPAVSLRKNGSGQTTQYGSYSVDIDNCMQIDCMTDSSQVVEFGGGHVNAGVQTWYTLGFFLKI